MAAEVPEGRGLARLVDAMACTELGQLPCEEVSAVRRAPVLDEERLEVDQDGLVIDEAHLDAQPLALSGVMYRIAGRPVAGSIWLPSRSKLLIRRTSS